MDEQIFKKTLLPFPDRSHCLLQNEFKKMRNNQVVTLAVTRSQIFILYERGTMKVADIDFELRFQLRSENRQLNQGCEETEEHTEKIFVLSFEKSDCQPIEFYNRNQSILNWRLILKDKLNMLNYQHFYQMERLVGQGSFASVYIAKRKGDNEQFAAKAFYKKVLYQQDPKAKSQIINEIKMLRLLSDHSHITKLFEVYENLTQIYLIIELCQGGTLEDFLSHQPSGLPVSFVKTVFYQLLLAVQYMHTKGIMHRDLKPANILFRHAPPTKSYMLESATVSIVLSDFGIATPITDADHIYTKCGSPGYMAPEVFTSNDYNEKVDIFSLGCVLFEMLTSRRVFDSPVREELVRSNQECRIDPKLFHQLNDAGSLLESMLALDPVQRPAIHEIIGSAWFNENQTGKRTRNRPKSSPPKKQLENQLPQFKIKMSPIHHQQQQQQPSMVNSAPVPKSRLQPRSGTTQKRSSMQLQAVNDICYQAILSPVIESPNVDVVPNPIPQKSAFEFQNQHQAPPTRKFKIRQQHRTNQSPQSMDSEFYHGQEMSRSTEPNQTRHHRFNRTGVPKLQSIIGNITQFQGE